MPQAAQQFRAGQKIAVTQQIPLRDETWTLRVEGELLRYEQRKTGSWYAHAKDDRLWLDRLVIRKSDGEQISLALDANTHVEILLDPAPGIAPGADASGSPAAEGKPA